MDKEKVMGKAAQIIEVLKDCEQSEIRLILACVVVFVGKSYTVTSEVGNGFPLVIKENDGNLSAIVDSDAEQYEPSLDTDIEAIEKESIIRALQRNHGSRKKAAEDLLISERTLFRKIEKYGIDKEVKQ